MSRIAGFFFLLMISYHLNAQNCIVSGKSVDYSGKEILFYTYSDPVVNKKHELNGDKIASDGSFSVSLPIERTTEVYADLGKYTGTLIVEPGKSYFVTLPPFSPKTEVEAKSPYFSPRLYWFGLSQDDDLNLAIRSFITDYNNEIVKNSEAIYKNSSKEAIARIIELLEKKYTSNKNEFFRQYRQYNYADLEYLVNRNNLEGLLLKYFATKPVQLHHTVYIKVFEALCTDYLRKYAMENSNRFILGMAGGGNFNGLVKHFENKGYRKDFSELLVLRGLYDGYYTGGFNKTGILKAIAQAQTSLSTESLKPVAIKVRQKLTALAAGGKAPFFELNNLNNELTALSKFKGRYVYLVFVESSSRECRAELDSIAILEKRFRQALTVVSIATDENFADAAKLWKEKGYGWELLNGSKKKQVISDYNANVVPAFYLLNPEGNLLLSPAPAPSHEFEPIFLKILREQSFKQQGRKLHQ